MKTFKEILNERSDNSFYQITDYKIKKFNDEMNEIAKLITNAMTFVSQAEFDNAKFDIQRAIKGLNKQVSFINML